MSQTIHPDCEEIVIRTWFRSLVTGYGGQSKSSAKDTLMKKLIFVLGLLVFKVMETHSATLTLKFHDAGGNQLTLNQVQSPSRTGAPTVPNPRFT